MRSILISSILSSIFLLACNKDKITLKDIRQTDAMGNVLSEGNPAEWTTDEGQDILDNHFGQSNYGNLVYEFHNLPINFCFDDAIDGILIYPNPVHTNSDVKFKITTEKDILALYLSTQAGQLGATIEQFNKISENEYLVIFNSHDFANQNDRVNYIILTKDSCSYSGYGNIMVVE